MTIDTLVYARYLLTMAEGEKEWLEKKIVAIDKGKIIDVYDDDRSMLFPLKKGRYEAKNGYGKDSLNIVMPGFVNAHGHCPLRRFRGMMPDHLEQNPFNHIRLIERNRIDWQSVGLDTELAISEMKSAGITTTAEMYYYSGQMAEAFRKHNMRAVLYETLLSGGTHVYPNLRAAYNDLEKREGDDLVTFGIGSYATYGIDEFDLPKCVSFARRIGLPIMMHAAEWRAEVPMGRGAIDFLHSLGALDPEKVTLAGCVNVTGHEMSLLKENDVGVAFNPMTNHLMGLGEGRLKEMSNLGMDVGLGMDMPVFNDRMDMFSQMRIVRGISCYDIVKMATIGAAKALHMEDKIGSIEVGKYGDLIVIKDSSRRLPYMMHNKPYQFIVRNMGVEDIETILVGGK